MIAIDTSVAVAALTGWHVAHADARSVAAGASIPAHARLETYSVLTRMRPPHRLAPGVVASLLEHWFPGDRTLVPSANANRALVGRCSERAIAGGAVYDALVAITTAETGLHLVTRDTRAARTYARLEVPFELMR